MNRLQDITAIVTGGTQGIGRAIVERFVAEGARVMTCARSEEEGTAAAEQINAEAGGDGEAAFCRADMGETDDIERLVERTVQAFGPPGIAVNNAASTLYEHTGETAREQFDQTIRVNVRGYWWLARTAYPHMKALDESAVLNVASTHPYRTKPGHFPYNMSKGAILAMNKAMAIDFGADGIRVNAVVPGIVDTQVMRDWIATLDEPERKREEIRDGHPLGRIPLAKEVAQAALYLAGPEGAGVSGHELVVDCGREVLR
jgi:NAD(P)-dependent dehydrogenase (short-subunit alcohol dehydrogenase family)